MKPEKQKIRSQILSLRKTFSYDKARISSKKILEKIYCLSEFQQAQIVFTYVSFGKEVRTYELIEELFKTGKSCLVPKVNREKNELDLFQINNWLDLKRGYKGILEPRKNCRKITDYKTISIAFIPGVAFDKKRNRLGYGKGFFDKLLSEFHKETLIIGLAFRFQILEKLPHEKHDIKVQLVISD